MQTKQGPINIVELTRNQPFCAGVIVMRNNDMIVTLNDDLSDGLRDKFIRVGGVGGGREVNETIAECAKREAVEELDTLDVRLLSSDITYFHNMDNDEVYEVETLDEVSPFLIQRCTNRTPNEPYKPGLPTGPYVYFGIYLAETNDDHVKPGDDVSALLYVPIEKWELLLEQPTISDVLIYGFDLIEANEINRNRKLLVPADESLHMAVTLLKQQRK